MDNKAPTEPHPLVLLYKRTNLALFLGFALLCGLQSFLLLNTDPESVALPVYRLLLSPFLACALFILALSAMRQARHWQPLAIMVWIFSCETAGWGVSRATGFPFGSFNWTPDRNAIGTLLVWACFVTATIFCQWLILTQSHNKSVGIRTKFSLVFLTVILNALLLNGILPVVSHWPKLIQWQTAIMPGRFYQTFAFFRVPWLFFILTIGMALCSNAWPNRSSKYTDPTPMAVFIGLLLPLVIVSIHFRDWGALMMIAINLILTITTPHLVSHIAKFSQAHSD